MSEKDKRDLYRGCLIGGAAGDALGYAVEFMGENSIFARFGAKGITEYELTDGVAEISDDTQMTLFTAAGMLSAAENRDWEGEIHRAYLDWLKTQREAYPLPAGAGHTWLVNEARLFDRRAPGNTCLCALSVKKPGSLKEPINSSKGCGGVMRAAPVGLYFAGTDTEEQEAARVGAESAAITHGHILGWMPAAVLAQTVCGIVRDGLGVREAMRRALDTVKAMWPETKEREYFIALMELAEELADKEIADIEAIHKLGEGWVAEETLAIAAYCAMRYEDDFDKAMIAAVNHKGDSDSTGAVAGNILGARLGLAGIPAKYTEKLELKDVILKVADELYEAGRG